MTKKTIYPVIPSQVYSDNVASVFPDELDKNDQGGLQIGSQTVSPFNPSDGSATMPTQNRGAFYNPSTGLYETLKALTVIKPQIATAAGYTTVWTPTAGKKFRLLGYAVQVPSTATSAGGSDVNLADQGVNIGQLCSIGATTGAFAYSVTLPGAGYLSLAANNLLRLNLSAAFTAGGVIFTAWGCEE